MLQDWKSLTFLHWRVDAGAMQQRLPKGLEVATFDGSAWVGMTPFELSNLRAPLAPAVPWVSTFPETNLRTYVRSRWGKPGIWFFTLEAARWLAVAGARVAYGLPYRWARMSVEESAEKMHYRSRRHADSGTGYDIEILKGEPIDASPLEVFLTARFRLYTSLWGKLAFADWSTSHGRFSARRLCGCRKL